MSNIENLVYTTNYQAKKPDASGHVAYTEEENSIWHDLYIRQIEIIKNRACAEFINGLDILKLSSSYIPQLKDLNHALGKATGWGVHPVEAIIPHSEFFDLLANKKFPAATFIRHRKDFDYITEPDIFHEFFGHCPMLTNPIYADFMQAYGRVAKTFNEDSQKLLARLYWFTVEFGLIKTNHDLCIYGGGILSSPNETVYAVESNKPLRKPFDVVDILRTPFRIDILQPIYFVIDSYQQLYDITNMDLAALIAESRKLGEHKPLFDPA